MPTLTNAFLAARDRHGAVAIFSNDDGSGMHAHFSNLSIPVLEETLAELVARGNAAHLELRLDAALFAAHLGRCGTPVETSPAAMIHAEDLFLAASALYGDLTAVAKLQRLHRAVIVGYLRQIDTSTPFVDEVEQRLWDSALVERDGEPAKLASYSGQGALAAWVGSAAHRIALMIRRHEAADECALDGAAAEADALASAPELAFIKSKLRGKFQGALTQALVSLEDRERMIYRLHLVNGMTVEMIAKVYRVSPATISRWLANARESVIRETQRLLREEMRMSPAEFESVAAMVLSQLDLSVSRVPRYPM